MSKFNEGDRVKIVGYSPQLYGKLGVVENVYHNAPYPYGLTVDGQHLLMQGSELESVEEEYKPLPILTTDALKEAGRVLGIEDKVVATLAALAMVIVEAREDIK